MDKDLTNSRGDSTEVYRLISKLAKNDILRLARLTCKDHSHSYLAHPSCAYKDGILMPAENGKSFVLKEKIGIVDIETFTFNFKADMGIVLTYCIKEWHGKVIKNSITPKECQLSKNNDFRLIKDFVNDLKTFTRVIGYYSTGFDIPVLRTKAVHYGIDFPIYKEILHTDVYYMIKHRFSLRGNSLRNACKYFGISAKDHPFTFQDWYNAAKGEKEALNYVLQHNIEDCISTEELYDKVNQFSLNTKKSI
jgi:uncharacterized protein YprB with RNaseH-like and TPR domain